MACAIFNPFCCCTAGMLAVDKVESATVANNCCQSQSTARSNPAQHNDDHNSDECPHKALKEYQANELKNAASMQDTFNCLPVLYALAQTLAFKVEAPVFSKASLVTASHAPPRSLSQVYCIYRI